MLSFKNSVVFTKGEAPPVLLRNFYEPEDGFVWGTSRWSEITFSFTGDRPVPGTKADLVLDLDVFKAPPTLPCQTVLVYLNGLRIGSKDVNMRLTAIFPFPGEILRKAENVLTFDTPNVSVPSAFGIPDERLLSVQLFSLQLRRAE